MEYTYNAKDFARFLDNLATKMACEDKDVDIATLYTLRSGAVMLSVLSNACSKLAEVNDGNPSKAEITLTIPVCLGESSLNEKRPPE